MLSTDLREALTCGQVEELSSRVPDSRRDRFLTLQQIYALHLDALPTLGDRVVLQHHPILAALKTRLESEWIHELDSGVTFMDELHDPDQVHEALLDIAIADRLPATYKWLAQEATWPELVRFLALEGGPDGGFDDLVALCQVGLHGEPKLELARNYWDEMGNGDLAAVHTVLHDDLVAAANMPRIPADEQPEEGLERACLNGLLATNRYLQPEFVGALGMTELQAGPRCRLILQGLERLGAPAEAIPFYREHAEVDPRHGADWVKNAVRPLVAADPSWGRRIVRGASWRTNTNLAFFAATGPAVLAVAS